MTARAPITRRLKPLFIALGMVLLLVIVFGGIAIARGRDTSAARALAGSDLASLERCMIGAPLGPDESLASRMRGIELANALAHDTVPLDTMPLDAGTFDPDTLPEDPTGVRPLTSDDPALMQVRRMRARDLGDAGPHSRGSPPPVEPPEKTWPRRCAPLAEQLGRRLGSPALIRDRSLDALRDALPTKSRLELPYALTVAESNDLSDAIRKANLPSSSPASDIDPAPTGLVVPPAAEPPVLGKGSVTVDGVAVNRISTDYVASRGLRFIVRGEKSRLCSLDPDDPKGPYATAKCGDLPAWMDSDHGTFPKIANTEDGSPTSLLVSRGDSHGTGYGVMAFTKKGMRVAPMTSAPDDAGVFVSKTGDFMIAGAYGAFIRTGSFDKIETTSPTDPVGTTQSVRILPIEPRRSVAAFGYVFFNDYLPSESPPQIFAQRVLPTAAAKSVVVGSNKEGNGEVTISAGCRNGERAALLLAETGTSNDGGAFRVIVSEEEGVFHLVEAHADSAGQPFVNPHLTCTHDAAVVTSVFSPDFEHVVVTESRCTAKGCDSQKSDPIAIVGGNEAGAASIEGGVVFYWKVRPDRVLSRAKGMAFFRMGPIDKLATATPTALIESKRGGGVDIDHIRLVTRPDVAIALVETGGKSPVTRAVRIDSKGTPSVIAVEETQW